MKVFNLLLITLVFLCGCASHRDVLTEEGVIKIVAEKERIDVNDYDVIARKDAHGWVVIFHGKSGVIGDEYAFLVDDSGRVSRVK